MSAVAAVLLVSDKPVIGTTETGADTTEDDDDVGLSDAVAAAAAAVAVGTVVLV